jgi:hypothetical protein
MKCRCGCGGEARWLVTGYDYDPRAKDGRGEQFTDEPCCSTVTSYLEECSAELGHPISKRPAPVESP